MTDSPPSPDKTFPIVGIGASAGGLEAFTQLLTHLPAQSGMENDEDPAAVIAASQACAHADAPVDYEVARLRIGLAAAGEFLQTIRERREAVNEELRTRNSDPAQVNDDLEVKLRQPLRMDAMWKPRDDFQPFLLRSFRTGSIGMFPQYSEQTVTYRIN